MMKDTIFIKQMEFYGYHGVLDQEKVLGQRFVIDICINVNFSEVGHSDDLSLTVNYAELFSLIKNFVENTQYNLLETLGEKLSELIFLTYGRVHELDLTIIKPCPPFPGSFEHVGISIHRKRAHKDKD